MKSLIKNMNNNPITPAFFLFTAAIVMFVLLIPLFMQGMHTDGVLYANMAKNMSKGLGSIWSPYNTSSLWPRFYEHPPLGLWLESLYFRLLGQSWLTVRLFCLTEAIALSLGIIVLWRRAFYKNKNSFLLWLPIFICFTNFLIIKDIQRNFLDTTLMCFSLWAAIAIIRSPVALMKNRIFALIIGSILMVMGFLANGFQSFFPIAIPVVSFFIRRNASLKVTIYETIFMVLTAALLFTALFVLQPAALHNVKEYILTQVLPSTIGNRYIAADTGFGRAQIFIYPFYNCAIGLVLALVFFLMRVKIAKLYHSAEVNKFSIFYLCIALTATVPVIAAHRQSPSYILQSMPFYSLAVAVWMTPRVHLIVDKLQNKNNYFKVMLLSTAVLAFLISLSSFAIFFASVRRDKHLLNAVNVVGRYVGPGQTIRIGGAVEKQYYYAINEYFALKYSIDIIHQGEPKWAIRLCNSKADANYKRVSLPLVELCLYQFAH